MQWLFSLWNFVVIQNFSGFATLLAGSVAWIVYGSQKRDKKINAARIILSEIRTAENKIDELAGILERGAKDFPSVLPANSWNTYSYLFASDFDQDQLEEINAFYNICEIIEDAAKRDNNYFWSTTEFMVQSGQTASVDIIFSCLKEDLSLDLGKIDKLKRSVIDNISTNAFIYSPQKTINILKSSISRFKKITTNTTGMKLKKIARISDKRRKFFN